jgi:hypothetical protein
MPISRMQQPRQMYGLGSLVKSVTKGVKSAVKGAASAVKDVAKSDIGKLALMYGATAGLGSLGAGKGFGSLLKLGTYAPSTVMSNLGASLFGSGALADYGTGSKGLLGTLGITPGFGIKEFAGKMGMAKAGLGLAGLTTFMSQQGMSEEEIEQVSRNPEALKVYLRQYYSALNPKAEPGDVEKFVQMNTAEYRADGGRIGFQQGGNFDFNQFLQDRTREAMQVQGIGQAIRPVVESNVRAQAARDLSQAAKRGGIESFLRGQLGSGIIPGMSAMQSPMTGTSKFGRQQVIDALTKSYMTQYSAPTDSAYDQMRFAAPGQSGSFVEMQGGQFGDGMGIVIDGKRYATEQEAIDDVGIERYNMFYAKGGRVGFAMGNPEQNAIEASGIMNLPLNQNPAGVTELDLRDNGGFIPPVGVKEKADDIPAMLSNNEFVFTADAVRNMGDGNVNKGAQRMYDFMKYLENGGRV